jgi:hypothetical protein
MEESSFIIQRGLFDNNSRELIIHPEYLSFEEKDKYDDLKTIFKKEEIISYRYGVKWYTFYLTYAREYQIHILNKQNKIIKIDFTNYFGNKKQESFRKYAAIIDSLWKNYFEKITKNYYNDFYSNKEIKINNLTFTKDYIEIENNKIVSKTNTKIKWKNVKVKNYQTYFCIYSSENPAKINFRFNYLNDWNVDIIYSLTSSIVKKL